MFPAPHLRYLTDYVDGVVTICEQTLNVFGPRISPHMFPRQTQWPEGLPPRPLLQDDAA